MVGVRVPLPHLWAVSSVDRTPGYEPGGRRFESCTAHGEHGMFPRCCYALLFVVRVTAWARVVGLRASRWACYYALIVPSRPPGLAGCIVSVAELVDALDLGSSVLRGVWVRVPPGALAAGVFGVSSCRSRSTRVMMGGTRLAGLVQFGRTPVL